MTPAIVLVHGAWHGRWCWERVAGLLSAQGLDVHTLDLPSTVRTGLPAVGAAGTSAEAGMGSGVADAAGAGEAVPAGPDAAADPEEAVPGLAQDAAALRRCLDGLGPVILCGHSYGGMVISAAGHAPRVAHLVYLCAFMPEAGESVQSILAADPRAGYWMRRQGPWTLPDPARAPGVFYGDCDVALQAWACAQLRAQASRTFAESLEDPAWRHRPSTYVVCAQDRVVRPAIQRERLAPRAGSIIELDSGHAPFFSRAAEVAALLAELARA